MFSLCLPDDDEWLFFPQQKKFICLIRMMQNRIYVMSSLRVQFEQCARETRRNRFGFFFFSSVSFHFVLDMVQIGTELNTPPFICVHCGEKRRWIMKEDRAHFAAALQFNSVWRFSFGLRISRRIERRIRCVRGNMREKGKLYEIGKSSIY